MFDLPDTITIWSKKASGDGLGGSGYDGPDVVSARYALKQEKFTDINGDQRISKAVCYSDSDKLVLGALVFLGTSTELNPVSLADDVRSLSATPSATTMKKAWF
jgi:hypothetical protein